MKIIPINVVFFMLFKSIVIAQQLPDTAFTFLIKQSAYAFGKGPVIMIDQAHYNFHTKDKGFAAFSNLLTQDGYVVKKLEKPLLNRDVLNNCKILVIANALNIKNQEEWVLPCPSAFTKEEIVVIKDWVKNGGNLILIADHMPFAGAATELGLVFGFEFVNGFAITSNNAWPPSVFKLKDSTLYQSKIIKGLFDYEKIDSVSTYTGSAFKIPTNAIPVLKFKKEHFSLQPDTAWSFNDKTPKLSLNGYFQGAVCEFGKGKIAVFGEAAMFTAQIVNGNFKVGINSETAPQNAQFVLNLVHWLDNIKKYSGTKVIRSLF